MYTYFLPPLMGAVIGYITNDIAIRMLFRPHKAKYILGIRVPFTPGIVPKEKGRIAQAVGAAISENLMNKEVIERTLLSDDILAQIGSNIDAFCQKQSKNDETLRAFVAHYLTDAEIETLLGNASAELEKVLAEKLATSSFGKDIAHIAIEHAMEKVSGGLLGVFGSKTLMEPITMMAEELLSKEIDKMIRNNAAGMIHKMVDEQSNTFAQTPMRVFFEGREPQIAEGKEMILSLYRMVVLEHLPKILATLDISQMIETRINEMDMAEMEPIILQVMNKELRAIVWFGAGLGALIGCLNLLIG